MQAIFRVINTERLAIPPMNKNEKLCGGAQKFGLYNLAEGAYLVVFTSILCHGGKIEFDTVDEVDVGHSRNRRRSA